MKKRYCTGRYKLQALLMQVEDIEIVDITKTVIGDKEFTNLVFEFKDASKVGEIIDTYKNDKRVLVDDYDGLMKRRKKKIDEYFNMKCGDRFDMF